MEFDKLYRQYDYLKKLKSVLYYQGAVTHEILGNLTEILKDRITNQKGKQNPKRICRNGPECKPLLFGKRRRLWNWFNSSQRKNHILKLSTANLLSEETASTLEKNWITFYLFRKRR
ncbi:hypothetical protein LEP1GSC170_5631 [Leptospira interrogans serovar Bataviae str. HAI135]|nr:hypothetical protein LEP1GSC170_5631 [Leptospira interrogans serovar Bataviae str. HAI135]